MQYHDITSTDTQSEIKKTNERFAYITSTTATTTTAEAAATTKKSRTLNYKSNPRENAAEECKEIFTALKNHPLIFVSK